MGSMGFRRTHGTAEELRPLPPSAAERHQPESSRYTRRSRGNRSIKSPSSGGPAVVAASSARRTLLLWTAILIFLQSAPCPVVSFAGGDDVGDGEEDETLFSDDEDGTAHNQLILGPMHVCLFPTPIILPTDALQSDMRSALVGLVTDKLQSDWTHSDMFEYFQFTDATIEWFSGEEDGSSSSGRSNPCGGGHQLQRQGVAPFTQLTYEGVVLMLTREEGSTDAPPNVTEMESLIGGVIENDLVQSLQNLESLESDSNNGGQQTSTNTPAYFEIKVASVSFGDDEDETPVPDATAPQVPPTAPPSDATTPVDPSPPFELFPTAPSQAPTAATNVVAGLQESNSSPGAAQGGPNSTGRTVGIVVGSLVALAALLVVLVHRRRATQRSPGMVVSRQSLDAPPRSNARRYRGMDVERAARGAGAAVYGGGDDYDGTVYGHHHGVGQPQYDEDGTVGTGGDASEMAQYTQYQQGEIMECISVASEWTLGTMEDASSLATRSVMSGNTSKLLKAAELKAARETFDRDRQITIQKDMLQTEWSASLPTSSGLIGDAAASSAGPKSLSFEQAYDLGQGEEVYLRPPRASRRSSPSRGGPAIV